MADANAYVSRIEKLETENRRIRWLIAFSFILVVVIVLITRQTSKHTLEAREFLLTDQSGQVAARLGIGKGGTCFEIIGKGKAAGATMCVGDDSGSSLTLTTNHGESKALLSAGGKLYETLDQTLSPGLIIAEGRNLFSATAGTAPQFLVKPTGNGSSVIVSVPRDNPRITIAAGDGKVTWSAP